MTTRPLADLLTAFADNANRQIDEQDLRDFLVSVYPHVKLKTATQSVTSSTVVVNDNQLFVPIVAGRRYAALAVLFAEGSNAGDFRGSWALPTGAAGRHAILGTGTTGTTFENTTLNNQVGSATTDLPAGLLGAGNLNTVLDFLGLHTAPTADGNLTYRWAQLTSNATATTLHPGSFLVVLPVNN